MAYRLLQTNDKVSGRKDLPLHFYHNALHRLGYSKTLSEKRIKINENYAACVEVIVERNWHEGQHVIVAGSRGEGMAVSVGSDIDLIYVQPTIRCFKTDQIACSIQNEGEIASFELDLANAPEGYAKLRLISKKEPMDLNCEKKQSLLKRLNGALTERNKCHYLRNDHRLLAVMENDRSRFKQEGWISAEYKFDERSGPSQPHRIPLPFDDMHISVDYVTAFPCYYPSALADFCKRERLHSWPSNATIKAAKESKVLVVPTGETGRVDILHWRISFTQAEQLLVHSFNDTQIKVYASLKMLVKHHLKPKCSSISSYVVKNIVFWVFENSRSKFAEDVFIDLISQALQFIKDCVSRESLKNYIIPSRNMFKARILETEKAELLRCIDNMIEEGPEILLRCPLVKEMSSLKDDVALQRRLTFRELTDQLLYSYLSLPPETHNKIEKSLSASQNREDTIILFVRNVLPIARDLNPFDYFNLLISMTDGEILFRLTEGFLRNDRIIWTE